MAEALAVQNLAQLNGAIQPAVLEIENLQTHFFTPGGVVKAVDGVSYAVRSGETLGVVGESGCGKSVTALSVLRLVADPPGRIVGGAIRFEGRNLLDLHPRQMEDIRGNEISMIFQEPMTSLNPVYTVGNQIVEAIRLHRRTGAGQARARAIELLELVGIPSPEQRFSAYPHQLSGGMRQRVMIAMALACEPRLLIADEPTTALDVTIQRQILDLLARLQAQRGLSMLFISHDLGLVGEVAQEVVVLRRGTVREHGPVQAIFDAPQDPYTKALLGALPQIEGAGIREGRLTAIPGRPPDLADPPTACRFAPRCPFSDRNDSCAKEEPQLREVRAGHWVRSAHPACERPREPVGAAT